MTALFCIISSGLKMRRNNALMYVLILQISKFDISHNLI